MYTLYWSADSGAFAIQVLLEELGAPYRREIVDTGKGEQTFAKLKALLRKAAARTVNGLWSTIGQLLDLFPPAECANYLAHSGYRRSA